MSSRSENPDPGLAVVMRAFEGGGAQRDMVLLCNGLAAKGVRITVLALQTEGPLRALLDPAISVVEVPGRQLRYAIPGLRRLIRGMALGDTPPSLVLSSEASLNLCTLIAVRTLPRRSRPKLVLREVGSPSIAQHHDPYLQNRIAYRILRRVYAYADRIVTLTEGARRDLTQNFAVPDEMISVMLTNAVVPPAAADRIAQWDGETGRERRSHRQRRPAVSGEGSAHPDPRHDLAAGGARVASRHCRRRSGTSRARSSRAQLRPRRPRRLHRPGRRSFCLDDAGARCRLRLGLRRSLQRHYRSAGLRHAGGIDELPLRAGRDPARRPLRHADAGRRCRAMAAAIAGGAGRGSGPRRAAGARHELHRRARGRQISWKSLPIFNRCRRGPTGRSPSPALCEGRRCCNPSSTAFCARPRGTRDRNRSQCATRRRL